MRRVFVVGLRASLFGLLAVTSVAALAAGDKLGGPAPAKAVAASAADPEPTTRLMVRYKAPVKMAGQGGVTVATERHEAAMRVAKTANLSGLPLMDYLKSVSPSVHVVELPNRLSPAETQAAIDRMRSDEGVADVAIDHRMKPHRAPNDSRFTDGAQWHLRDSMTVPGGLNAAAAWDLSSGSGVVVAVLDGGYRPHPDLVTNLILPGYDFVSADPPNGRAGLAGLPFWTANDGGGRDGDARDPGDGVTSSDVTAGFCDEPSDSSWHGTHVAGIVAAKGDNGRDGLGVAYGARVLPVRVLGRCGGYTSDILAGARWAAGLPVPGVNPTATPANILNLSLGVPAACDAVTQSEIDAIRNRNVSIVASAGNDFTSVITLPANCRGVVAVTAHTREGDNAIYANVGAGVTISAPGGGSNQLFFTPFFGVRGVMSTLNDGTTAPGNDIFAEEAGTSMAAPQVAGVLALVASMRPDLSMATLEGVVTQAVRAFPAGSYCAVNPRGLAPGFCGSGLLDAQLAVEAVRPVTADLAVSQNLITGYVVSGESSQYSITVRNIGRETATSVQLSAALSGGMEVLSVAAEPSDAVVSSSVNAIGATLGRLLPGQSLTLLVVARIANAGAALNSTVSATTASQEFSTANNSNVLVLPVAPVINPDPGPGIAGNGSGSGSSGGGGGCTMAPGGQADAGLPLLVLLAALVLLWRRRSVRR